MLGNIMDFVAWAIIINVFASVYVLLVSRVMPHFLFTPDHKKMKITDRGLKKYTFPEGRGVLYEPDMKYRRYINKYLLFEYKGKKYIKCRISDEVDSMRYEVALFDNKNRLIKVMEMAENIANRGETKSTLIPKNTSYASIVLKKVNEDPSFDSFKHFSIKKTAIFSAITVAMTVVYGLLIRRLITFIDTLNGGNFAMSVELNVISSLIVGVLAALLCISICKKRILGKE